jgi:peptidoglycan/LPS O-acetylase OafA/YrhL
MNANTGASSNINKFKRLDHIDGLRALAAMYVTMHHVLLYVNDDLTKGKVKTVLGIFIFGHYAVDVFIVLSGFCLMLPVIRNQGEIFGGTMTFFRKRARRILPAYYSAVALSLVLIWFFIGKSGSLWGASLPVTTWGILSHLFLIQDLFEATHHQINYVLWSVSVEWRIYFLFPLLVFCWKRFGALCTVTTTAILSSLLLIPLQYSFFDTSGGGVCLHYYGLFAFGMLAAGFGYSEDGCLLQLRKRVPWGALFVVICGVTLTLNKGYCHGQRIPWQCEDLLVGLGTLSLLVAITPCGTVDKWHWVRNMLGWAPLVFVGTFSYSLYLLHAPLMEVIWVYFVHPLNMTTVNSFILLSTAGVAVIVGLSYLFFLLCERPFLGSRKKDALGVPVGSIWPVENAEIIPAKAGTLWSSPRSEINQSRE